MESHIIITVALSCLLAGALFTIYDMSQKLQRASTQAQCPIIGPHSVIHAQAQTQAHTQQQDFEQRDAIRERDVRVLNDPLYPPINRQDADSTRRLMSEPRLQPTASSSYNSDSYRLVGYLVNSQDKSDSWKLFARQSQPPRRSLADFYAEPASRDTAGLKIPLSTQDGVTSPRLRDIYDLPDQVTIKHPMFQPGVHYIIVQLPSSDLASGYI